MNELLVYIADDHAIVVDGLMEILKSATGIRVLGTAANGEELLGLMNNRRADLVIMDINMPKMNGIQCTERIKKDYPATKVIILTMYPERSYISQLIKAGADGCLLKSRGSLDLIEAVERIKTSRSYFDRIQDFAEKEEHPAVNLSDREIEIIRLMVSGLTSAEIAERLFLSEHTVKTHKKNIYRKIKINSATELTTFAMNNQLLN